MSAFEDFIQVELPRRPWVTTDPAQESVPVRRGAGPRQLDFVEMTDGQVLGKVGGVVQGVNISGLGTQSYVFVEPTNSGLWVINHNLNSEDFVIYVADSSGTQVFPDSVTTTDADNVLVSFATPQSGKAVLVFA